MRSDGGLPHKAIWYNEKWKAFFEPDNDHGLTAVCTENLRGPIRNLFRGFPLWQPPTVEIAPQH